MHSTARIQTANAARYMTQLCKHWGHKFEVAYDETQAKIVLPLGPCLAVKDGGLDVTVQAADQADLTKLEQVVADHLNRFAHREGELTFDWRR